MSSAGVQEAGNKSLTGCGVKALFCAPFYHHTLIETLKKQQLQNHKTTTTKAMSGARCCFLRPRKYPARPKAEPRKASQAEVPAPLTWPSLPIALGQWLSHLSTQQNLLEVVSLKAGWTVPPEFCVQEAWGGA